jgi:hypothetical protein
MVAAMSNSASNSAAVAASSWVTTFLERLPAPAGELEAVQWRGREALSRQPLPTRRQEDWRFTDLAPLTALTPALAPAGEQGSWPAPAAGAVRLWLDAPGDPLAGQSLPAGISLLGADEVQQALGHTLAACNCEQHWPVELNQASAPRVLALRVSAVVAPTLELVSQAAGDGVMRPVRVLLLLEEKASLEVLQVQLGGRERSTAAGVQPERRRCPASRGVHPRPWQWLRSGWRQSGTRALMQLPLAYRAGGAAAVPAASLPANWWPRSGERWRG